MVTFNFGTLTNMGPGDGEITLRYQAAAINSQENARGIQLTNQATWRWSGGTSVTATPLLTIVEPELTVSKSADTYLATPGSTITFTLFVDHSFISNQDAFDLELTDELEDEFAYVLGSLDCDDGDQDPDVCTYEASTRTIRALWNSSAGFTIEGGEAEISFDVVLGDVAPGDNVPNIVELGWTSLPGDVSDPQSAHNTLSTERFYDPPDPVNVYGTATEILIQVPGLPDTGFAPGRTTPIRPQPEGLAFQNLDLQLNIPALGKRMAIVGVPMTRYGWDVTWLRDEAGYLTNTAFPTTPGNTVLTAHVYQPDGLPGPFQRLSELRWGDEVIIESGGLHYIYRVRELRYTAPNDLSVLGHEEFDWLTLVTCRGFDETTQSYRWRVVVGAVLVEVSP
jgi:LPXTG-site transpeptidase (sortase) family protein